MKKKYLKHPKDFKFKKSVNENVKIILKNANFKKGKRRPQAAREL